jgi:hypothetical protein
MHQGKFETVTLDAGADLSAAQYKAVAVGGTIAADSSAIGLLQNKPGASGRRATVGYAGQMKAYAGAAITAGARVTVTTSGWLITATSANIDGGFVVGKALAAANSGDLFPGLFNFAK